MKGFYAEYSNYETSSEEPVLNVPLLKLQQTSVLYRFDDLPWCYGCNPADFGISIKNRIAFIFRGRCDYFTKIKNTFPYEPDAIIIINSKQYHGIPRISYHDCKYQRTHTNSRLRKNYMKILAKSYFHTLMDLAGDDKVPWIPKVVAVSYITGQAILDEMKNGNEVTITIKFCHDCPAYESGFKSII